MELLQSEITCPRCGFKSVETMSTDACHYFYDCKGCGRVIRAKHGDCCVFCSYGTTPCPPKQLEHGGSGSACCAPAAQGDPQSRDWLSNFRTYSLAWCLPLAFLPIGLLLSVPLRVALWSFALPWMGGACLINAQRSGRTHCRFTGPYYLAMIIPLLVMGSLSASLVGWLLLGTMILIGSKAIWWATERAWGRFSGQRSSSA